MNDWRFIPRLTIADILSKTVQIAYYYSTSDNNSETSIPSDKGSNCISIHPAYIPESAIGMLDIHIVLISQHGERFTFSKLDIWIAALFLLHHPSPRAARCHFWSSSSAPIGVMRPRSSAPSSLASPPSSP